MILSTRVRTKFPQVVGLALSFALIGGCSTDDSSSGGGGSKNLPDDSQKKEDLGNIAADKNQSSDAKKGGGDGSNDSLTRLSSNPPAVRNYVEVYDTMAALTGVPRDHEDVRPYYENTVKRSLPTKSEADGFLASHQVGVTKLATEFCDAAYRTHPDFKKKELFGQAGVADRSVIAFNANNVNSLAKNLISNFWGVEESSLSNDDENVKGTEQLALDLVGIVDEANPNATDDQFIRGGVVGTCAAVLSSAQVTVY